MLHGAVAPYAALLGALMIVLSLRISLARMRSGISLGWGDDPILKARVRAFGNFAEWAPMALVLLVLAEAAGAPPVVLHAGGAALLIGRLLHPLQLDGRLFTPLRFAGMVATYASIAVATFYLLRRVAGI